MLVPAATAAQPALERSTPESQGVSSAGIAAFIDAVEASDLEVHSFMLLRNGKVLAEGWWDPYAPDLRHIMFSASKTVTALGVGIAVDEGRLSLDDHVVSFFPEEVTDSVSDGMRRLTVRHLLSMSVGQEREAGRGEGGWVRTFLHTAPAYEPGTRFMYNNMATFVLSAIVQKATGERLFHYLQPRLFEPLGMENITWDINPEGITVGMIGARLHTEDLAKLGQLLLQKGSWNGEQVVSAAYVDDLSAIHISNHPDGVPLEDRNDNQLGYGYQVWHGRHNSFRLDGLGGQLSIVLPDLNAVVVLTSNVRSIQQELDLVWRHLLPAFTEGALPADPAGNARLREQLAGLAIAPARHTAAAVLAGAGAAPVHFTLDENPLGIRSVAVAFAGDRCVVALGMGGEERVVEAGLGGWRRIDLPAASLTASPPAGGPRRDGNGAGIESLTAAAATCGMQDEDTLELTVRFLEDSLGAESWTFDFASGGSEVSITPGGGRRPGAEPVVLRGRAATPGSEAGAVPGR